MIVLPNLKLVWSSVPRTGTLSMVNLLKLHGGFFIPKSHSHDVPEKFKLFHRFMVIRNPYTRLYSWWRWWRLHDSRHPVRPKETFLEFLVWLNKNKNFHTGKYFYSYDSQVAFGTAFGCNTYLYLENLPADFKKIHALRNAGKHWTNAVAHKQPEVEMNLTSDEIELVNKHSGQDFERFGYVKMYPTTR